MTRREWQKALDLMKVHRLAQVSLVFVFLVVLMALFPPLLPLADPREQDLRNTLPPPLWEEGGNIAHPLRTDFLGRDMLSRVIWASRISLLIGVSAVGLAAAVGVPIGLFASYRGGLVDEIVMRI